MLYLSYRAPLINIRHLNEGFKKLKKQNFITVFPVVAFSYPVWRGLELDKEGKSNMLWPNINIPGLRI